MTLNRKARCSALWKKLALLLTCLAATAAGCAVAPIYPADGPKSPAAAVTSRRQWKASGDLRDPEKAIDGTPDTAAIGDPLRSGAAITIDLGKACLFNMVAVDHGLNETGFCRRLVLLSSMDGSTFERRYAVPGTRRITTLCLVSPVLARYIRLEAVIPGEAPWSIAEVYVQ